MEQPIDVKLAVDRTKKAATIGSETQALAHSQSKIVILTSVCALFAAFSGLMSARTTTRGSLAKNEAILHQDRATDEWAFYQSRNFRIEIAEVTKLLAKQDRAKLESIATNVARFEKERDETFTKAKALEAERDVWNEKSRLYMEMSKTFASALVFLQVALLLIPMTLIAHERKVLILGLIIAAAGLGYLVYGYAEFLLIPVA